MTSQKKFEVASIDVMQDLISLKEPVLMEQAANATVLSQHPPGGLALDVGYYAHWHSPGVLSLHLSPEDAIADVARVDILSPGLGKMRLALLKPDQEPLAL